MVAGAGAAVGAAAAGGGVGAAVGWTGAAAAGLAGAAAGETAGLLQAARLSSRAHSVDPDNTRFIMPSTTPRARIGTGGSRLPAAVSAQSVQGAGVVAGHRAPRSLRQALHLRGDDLPRVGPGAVRMGVVGGPHHAVLADDRQLGEADRIVLESGPDLAMEVLAGPPFEQLPAALRPDIADLDVLAVLVVHPLQHVGQPGDPRLGQHQAQVRVALQHAA